MNQNISSWKQDVILRLFFQGIIRGHVVNTDDLIPFLFPNSAIPSAIAGTIGPYRCPDVKLPNLKLSEGKFLHNKSKEFKAHLDINFTTSFLLFSVPIHSSPEKMTI